MESRKIICYLLIFALTLSIFSFNTNVYASTDDYKMIYWGMYGEKYENYRKPTAGFSLSYNGQTVVADSGAELNIKLGETITVKDLSSPGSGTAINGFDWQVYGDTSVGKITVANSILSSLPTSIKLQYTGTYDFYLCVRDNQSNMPSDGATSWQNWSDNGSHRSYGTSSTGKQMWWYFVHVRVNVTSDKPVADMEFSDTSNTTKNIYLGESFTLVDKSYAITEGASIVGWSVKAGSNPQTYITDPNSFFKTYTPAYTGTYKYTLYYVHDSNSAKSENPAKTLTVIVSQRPQPGQGKVIYEYYKDSVSPDNLLGTNEVGISNPYTVVLPDTYGDNLGFKSATYSGGAVSAGGSCKNGTNITITDATKDLIIQAIYKAGATGPVSSPPIAVITGPKEVMAGDIASVSGAKSEAFDGKKVVAWYWDAHDAELPNNIQRPNIGIWYRHPGEYTVNLYVADSEGLESDTVSHDILVTMPYPKAVITVTGNLKENRKVTISANDSISPQYYPIDETKTQWTITPLTAGMSTTDIKPSSLINGSNEKDILFKKAGKYKITLKVTNTYGLSDITEKVIDIIPDLPPVADFAVPGKILRDPNDNNYALFEIQNLSYSPDGDSISKSMLIYAYDSDNDGDFTDESWKYSINGSTWININKPYSQLPTLDVLSMGVSNISKFTLKTKEVGKYRFELYVVETFPDDDTLLEFINDSDYRRSSTFE